MAPAETCPITTCASALLADEALRLIRQRGLYEQRSTELFDAATVRLIEVEDAVLKMRPRSRRGAAYQILVAACAIEPMSHAADAASLLALQVAQNAITVAALSLLDADQRELAEFYSLDHQRPIAA